MSEFIDWFWQFISTSLLATWAGLIATGLFVELIVAPGRRSETSSTWLNIRYGIAYAAAIFLIIPATSEVTNSVLRKVGSGFIDLDIFSSQLPEQMCAGIVLLIITDFFYYWLHRMQHTLPWLWDQHAVHHSDEALNIATAVRHNWLEFIFQAFAVGLPMSIVFKLSPVSIWGVSTFVGAYSWFIHMNVRVGFGSMSWLACSPQLHRIHHSILPQHHNKNYAAYFPLWDVMFGTYYPPAHDEYPPTGVSGVKIETAGGLAIYPFHQWTSKLRHFLSAKPSS